MSEPPRSPPHRDLSPYHITRGRLKGPHEWTECPHRSPDRSRASPEPFQSQLKTSHKPRSHSVPHSPIPSLRLPSSPYHQRCVTLPQDVLLPSDKSKQSPKPARLNKRPPFIVRHIDETLMDKRNFCGVVNGDRPNSRSSMKPGVLDVYCDDDEDMAPAVPLSPPPLPSAHHSHLQRNHQESDHISYSPISSVSPSSSSGSSLTDIPDHLRPSSVIPEPIRKDNLVSKYLTRSKGNVKPELPKKSPDPVWTATAICNRLDRLRERCCECLVSCKPFIYLLFFFTFSPPPPPHPTPPQIILGRSRV